MKFEPQLHKRYSNHVNQIGIWHIINKNLVENVFILLNILLKITSCVLLNLMMMKKVSGI